MITAAGTPTGQPAAFSTSETSHGGGDAAQAEHAPSDIPDG